MQAPVFDGITRELGERPSRRGVMRLLGGAAAMGAVGLVVGSDAEAKRRGRNQGQVTAEGRGKKPKITICYQGQTLTVKKKRYQQTYPGATVGPCPITGGGGTTQGGGGSTQGGQQPACTTWIISGGPNPTDKIHADDDLNILRNSPAESILSDGDGKSGPLNPVEFEAKVGEVLIAQAYDAGGCRSLSPLWLHCKATGQKREVFTGLASPHCKFGPDFFIDQPVTVSV